ncbi:MAG: serine hydrolase domain-containing protein [Pseudomonadota bacterium]
MLATKTAYKALAAFCFTWLAAGCALPAKPLASAFERADGTTLQAEDIDATVTQLMEAGNVAGLGVALIDGSGVRYLKTYGYATQEKGTLLQASSVMYGASLTKATFAYAVMTLVDEGRVDLDAPIADVLPQPLSDYEDYADLADDPRWHGFTLRMLLSHTSGLPNWRWFMPGEKLTIMFEPGTRYAYSGEGIQIAQMMLEEGYGVDVAALMQARVFDRFQMTNTSMTWREDFREDLARGHDKDGSNLGHYMRQSVRAAGSMDTTTADYAKFLAALLRGEGISAGAKNEMLSPQVTITSKRQFPTQFWEDTDANKAIELAYGLGWGLFTSRFGPAYFKEGHDDGWNNYALCLRDAERCLLLLSNSSNGESIFLYLADALLGETGLPWEWEGYVPYDRAATGTSGD